MIKSLLKVARNSGYYKGQYYRRLTNVAAQLRKITALLNSTDLPVFESRIFIQPLGCMMGSSLNSVEKTIEQKPHFTRKSKSSKLTTIVYKESPDKYNVVIQFHFVANNLTFARADFQSTQLAFTNLRNHIKDTLRKKYLALEFDNLPTEFVIKDKLNNKIFFIDSVFFPTVFYVMDNSEIRAFLNSVQPMLRPPKSENVSRSLNKIL